MDDSLRTSGAWKDESRFDRTDPANFPLSFSGHERNHLFVSRRGEQFEDVSGLSGLDSPSDGRGFAIFDYDRDGWPDIALVNSNHPWLNLYRNAIGECQQESQMIAVRLVGGNRESRPSSQWSNRDGYGARIEVDLGEMTLVREHRCGEGFAAQNSSTLLIGIGERAVRRVRVRWPSGREQQIADVSGGSLVTLYEDAAESPDGEGVVMEPYRRSIDAPRALAAGEALASLPRISAALLDAAGDPDEQPKLRLFTTTATWCPSCLAHMPQFEVLRARFNAEQLRLLAVPIDPKDTRQMLAAYVEQHQPAYELLDQLDVQERAEWNRQFVEIVDREALPTTIAVDREGRVVWASTGVPTYSDVQQLLMKTDAEELPSGRASR